MQSQSYLRFSCELLWVVCLGTSWRDEEQIQPTHLLFPGWLVEGCSAQPLPSPFCHLPPCFSAEVSQPLIQGCF